MQQILIIQNIWNLQTAVDGQTSFLPELHGSSNSSALQTSEEWPDPPSVLPVPAEQEEALHCQDPWTSTPDRKDSQPLRFGDGRVKAWLQIQSSAPSETRSKAVQTDGDEEVGKRSHKSSQASVVLGVWTSKARRQSVSWSGEPTGSQNPFFSALQLESTSGFYASIFFPGVFFWFWISRRDDKLWETPQNQREAEEEQISLRVGVLSCCLPHELRASPWGSSFVLKGTLCSPNEDLCLTIFSPCETSLTFWRHFSVKKWQISLKRTSSAFLISNYKNEISFDSNVLITSLHLESTRITWKDSHHVWNEERGSL